MYKDFSTSILLPHQHKIGRWSRLCGEYLLAQRVKNLPEMKETQFRAQVGKIPQGREWQPTPVFLTGNFLGQGSLAG